MSGQSKSTRGKGQHQSKVGELIRWVKSNPNFKTRHRCLLRFLLDYAAIYKRVCPSIRTLAAECGVTRQSVHRWLNELEELGAITRRSCVRRNGGKTSNEYQFTPNLVTSHVAPGEHLLSKEPKCKEHAAKPNVIKNNSNWRIKAGKMTAADCEQAYRKAVDNRWVSDSQHERLCFFSLWAAARRKFASGVVSNPGAWITSLLKRGLQSKVGTAEDERAAAVALNHLRTLPAAFIC